MSVYLVRHAPALDASVWRGPDQMRPLTGAGHDQARGVAASLEDLPVDRIVSGPSARCLQTVAPLAKDRGLDVENADELGPEWDEADAVIDFLLSSADEDVVYCSHGELVTAVLEQLDDDGLDYQGDLEAVAGSVWVLEVDDDAFIEGRYLPARQVEREAAEDERPASSGAQPGSGGTWS